MRVGLVRLGGEARSKPSKPRERCVYKRVRGEIECRMWPRVEFLGEM